MSALLDLTTALQTALTGLPALQGGRVYRGRDAVLPLSETRGIRINTVRHAGTRADMAGQCIKWQADIAIALLARGSALLANSTELQDGEAAVDELLVPAWHAVMAMPVPPGVLDLFLEPLISYALDEADHTVCSAVLALRVVHITTAADLMAA